MLPPSTSTIPEYLKEYWPFAVLTRPQRGLYGLRAVTSAGLITLWALSRTAGLPLGPEPLHPGAASLPDLLAVALETGLILTIWSRRRSHQPEP